MEKSTSLPSMNFWTLPLVTWWEHWESSDQMGYSDSPDSPLPARKSNWVLRSTWSEELLWLDPHNMRCKMVVIERQRVMFLITGDCDRWSSQSCLLMLTDITTHQTLLLNIFYIFIYQYINIWFILMFNRKEKCFFF